MPLEPGKSKEAISRNIATEVEHGHPQKQAVAIAMRTAGVPKQDGDLEIVHHADGANDAASTELRTCLPETVTPAEVNERNRRFWYQNEEVGPSAGGPPLQGM